MEARLSRSGVGGQGERKMAETWRPHLEYGLYYSSILAADCPEIVAMVNQVVGEEHAR